MTEQQPDTATLDATITLGDLITRHPSLARELERRGLDYCCGGARSLGDACAELGLDAATVVDELNQVARPEPTPDWAAMGVGELVDHLEATHHRYLWDELPRLGELADKIAAVHGDRHPELAEVARCVAELRADIVPHLEKEETVLFPMVRELAAADAAPSFHCGSLTNPISVMLAEHDRVGELLLELRRLTAGFAVPADGCASYEAFYRGLEQLEADTHLHVHKENNVLFPAVVERERSLAASS